MEKVYDRVDDAEMIEKKAKEDIAKGTTYQYRLGIDPGCAHMAAVSVRKVDETKSREFSVDQPWFAHVTGQNSRKCKGQELAGLTNGKWTPLGKRQKKRRMLEYKKKYNKKYPFTKRATRRLKAKKKKEKKEAAKEAKVCITSN